jgi:hypothetical protein
MPSIPDIAYFAEFDKIFDIAYANRMGRPSLNVKMTAVRLAEETRERIRALVGDSGMAQFIRDAVERELKRRERKKD